MQLQLIVEVPDKVKNEITVQLQDMKKVYPQFQWIKMANYQVVVQSFGNSFNAKKVIERLEEVLFDKKIFFLYSNSVQLTIEDNITMYLDFQREKEIEMINEDIRREFLVFANDLKFEPHILLANYKIPSKQQYFVIKKRVSNLVVDISFKVSRLSLFEGAEKIHSFKLL